MDLERLKQLAKKVGGVVVVNGENPEFVILTYNKFKELEGVGNSVSITEDAVFFENFEANGVDRDQGEIERLNQEVLALKEEIRQRESAELASSEGEELGISGGVDL